MKYIRNHKNGNHNFNIQLHMKYIITIHEIYNNILNEIFSLQVTNRPPSKIQGCQIAIGLKYECYSVSGKIRHCNAIVLQCVVTNMCIFLASSMLSVGL